MKKKRTELPDEAFKKVSSVFVNGSGEVFITECRNIESYDGDCVRLSLCDRNISVYGEGLTLKTYNGDEISVAGKISRIELDP